MAKLRKIQFYRNGDVEPIADSTEHNVSNLKSAYAYAKTLFEAAQDGEGQSLINGMFDGEILLYRFSYNGQVHTLVGVVHVDGEVRSLEVLANYDMLGGEISAAITAALAELDVNPFSLTEVTGTELKGYKISELDGKIVKEETAETLLTFATAPTATNKVATQAEITAAIEGLDVTVSNVNALTNGTATNDIRVEVVEENGVLTTVNVTDTLAKVAHTGNAADVAVAPGITELEATTVQGALAELQGDIVAIKGKTITEVADQAVAVTTDEQTGNITIGLVLDEDEKVLSQTASGLKTTLTVDTKKYPTESTAADYDADKAGKTYIQIKGKDNEVISETDAAAFVKDGMLNTATIVKGTWTGETFTENAQGKDSAIKLVWNTDAGKDAMYINAETLVDSYIAGNEWIVFDQSTNTISHKTQNNFSAGATKSFGGNVAEGTIADVTLNTAGNSIEFNVPSFTVDAAGHVTVADDKTVKVALPAAQTITGETAITEDANSAFISTAVTASKGTNDDNYTLSSTSTVKTQAVATAAAADGETPAVDGLATALDVKNYVDNKVGSAYTVEGELEMSSDRVITHKTSGVITTEDGNVVNKTKGDVDDTTIKVPVITVNEYGHVTALNEESYIVKYPTVSGTEGRIKVETTTGENGVVNYAVDLATVTRVNNPTNDDSNVEGNPSESSFADENNKFTYVKDVITDAYGRVTGILTETVTEFFDAGTY